MSLLPVSFCEDLFSGDIDFKCDIYEKDNKYFVEMVIVGYEKKDINVSMKDGYLEISGSKENNEEDKDRKYLRREREHREFSRTFYLGRVDDNSVEATFKDGVLVVTATKLDNNNKNIEIK